MYRQRCAEAFCIQATADAALAQFFPTKQSNAVDHQVLHADRDLELKVAGLAEVRLPDLPDERHVHRDGKKRRPCLATNPERQSAIAHMSVTACDLARAQLITVRRAPIHPERLALMYRHRYLRGADTEALDRVRATTNECNTTQPEPVFECESSDRRRRSEIDREIALFIRRLDRSHGRPSYAWQAWQWRSAARRVGAKNACLFNVPTISARIGNIVATAGSLPLRVPVRRRTSIF